MNIEKFTFDTDFQKVKLQEAKRVQDEIQKRMFSEDSIQTIKDESFAKGFQKGREEAVVGIEQEISCSVDQVKEKLLKLDEELSEAKKHSLENGYKLCQAILHKMVPQLSEKLASQMHIDFIQQIFAQLQSDITISITLNPQIQKTIEKQVAEQYKNISFVPDESLPLQDCMISWPEGKAIKKLTQMMGDIDEHIIRLFSEYQSDDEQQSDAAADVLDDHVAATECHEDENLIKQEFDDKGKDISEENRVNDLRDLEDDHNDKGEENE